MLCHICDILFIVTTHFSSRSIELHLLAVIVRLPLTLSIPLPFQMILTVYLSDGEQAMTEVPITPETTCRDVVEFCKEPGESGCHLAEVWRGNGKTVFN